jgi:hypothetical protein
MKTWLITFPLLCAVGIATAQDKAPAPAARPEAAATTATAPAATAPAATATAPVAAKPIPRKVARHKVKHHKAKRLPRGDLRECLDSKDNAAIIRCSETARKH